MKKAPRREYYEEEFDDEDDVGGRKMRRDGYDGYGYAGGKSSLSAPMGMLVFSGIFASVDCFCCCMYWL